MYRPIDEGLGFHKKEKTEKTVFFKEEKFTFQPEEIITVEKKSLLVPRFLAYTIDLMIIVTMSLTFFYFYELPFYYITYFYTVIFFSYFLCFWQDQTLGQFLTGIKIDEKKFSKLFIRAFLLFIAPLTLGLFFIKDEESISGTKVLEY